MRDHRARIRAAFTAAGHPLDEDIVEELAQHAESAYESSRADGHTEEEASRTVERLVRGWAAAPLSMRRQAKRAAAV
ncbi:MAG: hypothetical protein Q8N52_06770, partial [Acidobacteriota bacterium]|nr:hypothetical protein [Acidobacteriota bacterium]